ncbi:MAG: T9SS type A sorting domain-containing protein [Sphingobacteriales bacterium]|nr:MAG: T9SS type A sorting domain-containing protein [Sphingobacteriales bacterium]
MEEHQLKLNLVTADVITFINPSVSQGMSLRISPNPASRQVTVAFVPGSVNSRTYRFTLVDVRGIALRSALLTRTATNYSANIDVSTLSPGLFFVLIQNEDGQTVRRSKLLKE